MAGDGNETKVPRHFWQQAKVVSLALFGKYELR
jgi:hypothetical protein